MSRSRRILFVEMPPTCGVLTSSYGRALFYVVVIERLRLCPLPCVFSLVRDDLQFDRRTTCTSCLQCDSPPHIHKDLDAFTGFPLTLVSTIGEIQQQFVGPTWFDILGCGKVLDIADSMCQRQKYETSTS